MKPKLKRDWVGLKVRTLVELESRCMKIPIGTVCMVKLNRAGLTLETEKCPNCGVALYIRRVQEWCVEIID